MKETKRPLRVGWLKAAALGAVGLVLFKTEGTIDEADKVRQREVHVLTEEDRAAIEEAEAELPEPTIWPLILAVGIMLGLWGIILQTFFFGAGLLLCVVAVVGWMNVLLRAPEDEYTKRTPHEEWKSQ
ncbi:MAG: hypothetical protein ACYDAG_04445 [Chloroflexota bacterium]